MSITQRRFWHIKFYLKLIIVEPAAYKYLMNKLCKVIVFFSSELCTWDPILCTMKLTHACMHSYQGKLDCSYAVFLTRASLIHGSEWYTACVGHPSSYIFLHGFKLCLWFWLSWFIIHRSTCCVHDWFGNEPLLNRIPCANTDVARWCYEWCLMPAW